MVKLTSCCCCCSVAVGAIILAVLDIILFLLNLAVFIIGVATSGSGKGTRGSAVFGDFYEISIIYLLIARFPRGLFGFLMLIDRSNVSYY